MSLRPAKLRVNNTIVAAKVIDDEAVIINLATGVYYSMVGVGGRFWALVDEGCDRATIAGTIAREYGAVPETVSGDLDRLTDQLLAEQLMVAASDGASASPKPGAAPRGAYAAPSLEVYRDMQDLLALDPPVGGAESIPWSDPKRGMSGDVA